jgi:putative membrane protein
VSLFSHWSFEPTEVLPLFALAALYWLRVRRLASRGRPVRRLTQGWFYAGALVTLLAVVSPVDWYGENRLFWVHMIQHLLLGDIAPLLVVAGLTGPVLRPLLSLRPVRWMRFLAHPLVALPLWIADLSLWHIPYFYDLALRHSGVHALEHTCFFLFGALMWAAVIEPLPGPEWFTGGWKAVYTLVVRVAGMALAQLFIWANHPFYSYYVAIEHSRAAALSDQRIGGAIMFTEGGIVTMLVFAWLFWRFTAETEVRQRLVEQGMDPLAAARAARYGRSARVRDAMRARVPSALPAQGPLDNRWRD